MTSQRVIATEQDESGMSRQLHQASTVTAFVHTCLPREDLEKSYVVHIHPCIGFCSPSAIAGKIMTRLSRTVFHAAEWIDTDGCDLTIASPGELSEMDA